MIAFLKSCCEEIKFHFDKKNRGDFSNFQNLNLAQFFFLSRSRIKDSCFMCSFQLFSPQSAFAKRQRTKLPAKKEKDCVKERADSGKINKSGEQFICRLFLCLHGNLNGLVLVWMCIFIYVMSLCLPYQQKLFKWMLNLFLTHCLTFLHHEISTEKRETTKSDKGSKSAVNYRIYQSWK